MLCWYGAALHGSGCTGYARMLQQVQKAHAALSRDTQRSCLCIARMVCLCGSLGRSGIRNACRAGMDLWRGAVECCWASRSFDDAYSQGETCKYRQAYRASDHTRSTSAACNSGSRQCHHPCGDIHVRGSASRAGRSSGTACWLLPGTSALLRPRRSRGAAPRSGRSGGSAAHPLAESAHRRRRHHRLWRRQSGSCARTSGRTVSDCQELRLQRHTL